MMRLGHIELCVTDPVKSKSFFEEILGFELVQNQTDQFIWLTLGEQEILLRPQNEPRPQVSFEESASNIVFYTDDLSGTKAQLEARGLQFKGSDNGCPTFTDLDGHWFQLVEA